MSSGLEKQCMNCGQPLKGHFCYQCGQSANTHRFSVLGFLAHDVVHGIWHVDKGILFTIKEILLRPDMQLVTTYQVSAKLILIS